MREREWTLNGTASRWIAVVLVLLGASSYGLLSPFIKMAYERGFSDVQVSASQITMGTAILWLLVLLNRKSWANPFRHPWIRLSLIGIFGLALTTFFYNNTLSKLDASLSIVLLFQFTWITILMECLYTRTRPSRNQIIAVVFVLAGTMLAVNLSSDNLETIQPFGVLLGLLSACTYSLFLFAAGKVRTTLHASMKSAVMLTASLPVLYIVYPPHTVFSANIEALLGWGVLLGMLGSVLPTLFFNMGIPKIGSSLSAMLASMELPVALTGAFFILDERVLPSQWIGMMLILLGIVVSEIRTSGSVQQG
ncbi:MAG: EamA family transporter [Paenibacillus sp.]|nr:EamA family transporter [Paenibacillus sp.]